MSDAFTEAASFIKAFYALSDKNTGPSPAEYVSVFAPEGQLEYVQVGSMVPATSHASITAWRAPAWENVAKRHHRVLGIYPASGPPLTLDGPWDVLVRGDLTQAIRDGSLRFVSFVSRLKVTPPGKEGEGRKISLYQVWLVRYQDPILCNVTQYLLARTLKSLSLN